MLQLDVVARFCNVFLLHSVDKAISLLLQHPPLITLIKSEWHETVPIEQNQIKLSVESVLLMTGLKTAGGVLPVVGVGILLRYLPTKQYIPYLTFKYKHRCYHPNYRNT
jgi:PTS system mannose-specific IIC component